MDWSQAFATTATTKLFLDDGQKVWISVRNELSHGEQRTVELGAFRRVYRDNEMVMELDQRAGADQKVLAWLVDWNLTAATGKTIDISTEATKRDAVKNLTRAHYSAIEAAIDAHVSRMAEEKKLRSGTTGS